MADAIPTSIAQPTALAARRKRGRRFWIVLSLSLLLGIPLLVYLAAWSYVNFGFMNRSIEQRLSAKFGTPSRVGSMQTDAFKNLSINEIAIEPNGSGEPLTIGATKLNFELIELLRDNRIRTLTLERPRIALRYDPVKGWNHALKISSTPGEPIRINRFDISDGIVSIELPPGRQFALSNINASFMDAVAGVAPFTVTAAMPSAEAVTVEGTTGPGRAFNTRVQGGLVLNRDAPPMAGYDPGLKGIVRYDFAAKRDAAILPVSAGDAPREPVGVSGTVSLKNIEWLVPGGAGQRVVLENQNVAIQGGVEQPAAQPGLLELRGVTINFGPLGSLSGDAAIQRNSPRSAKLTGASGTLDLGKFDTAFQPRLLGEGSIKGTVRVSDASASISLEDGAAAPTFDARVTAHDLQIVTPGGSTVAIDAAASVNWPALKSASVKLGNLAELQFDIADLNKVTGLAELTEAAQITGGKFNIKDLYAIVGGEINAGAVKLTWVTPYAPNGLSKLRISGLQVNGIAVDHWVPLLPAPEWTLSGSLVAELDLDHGALTGLLLQSDLAGKSARSGLSASGSVRWKLERDAVAGAGLKTTLFDVDTVSIPLASAGQVWKSLKDAGIVLNGYLKGSGIRYDSTSGAMTGRVRLEDGAADFPITDRERLLAADVLDAFNRGYTAALLRNVKVADVARVKQISADLTFTASHGKFGLAGTTQTFPLFVRTPLWDSEAGTVPAASFVFESSELPGGTCALNGELNWSGHTWSADALMLPDEKWSFKLATTDIKRPGEAWKLDGAVDLKNSMAGPLSVSIDALPLAQFAAPRVANAGAADDWRGDIRDLRVTVDPFSFAKGAPLKLAARAAARLDAAALAAQGHAFAQLDGPFSVDVGMDKENCKIGVTGRLDSYAALLHEGAFYIPPPARDKPASIKLALTLPLDAQPFGSAAHIEACEIDWGGLAKFSVVGSAALSGSELTSLQLRNIELVVPSLAAVSDVLGPPNMKHREPWFGDLKLGGKARFAGACLWTRGQLLPPVSGEAAIDGNLEIAGGLFRIGTATPFTMDGISGTVPVSLRKGAGPPRDGGPRAKVRFENAAYATLVACKQELEIEGLSNGFTIRTPLDFAANGALLSIGPITFGNIWPGAQDPRCSFRMSVLLNLDQILRANGVTIAGLSNCVLSGEPIECALVKTSGLRGPWELRTGTTPECKGDAMLSAPFYGGKLVAKDFNARGIFGPAPSFGGTVLAVGKGWPERNDGVNVQEFLKHYPQFGKFNVRMTAMLSGFETSSLNLAGIQSFVLDLDAVRGAKNEYWYDGALAMALNYALVRNSFPGIFSDDYIRALTFGVRELAVQFSLENGTLFGPRPKLPGGLILRGYGAESNPFASRYKKDIKGDTDYHKDWLDAVKVVREKFK